MNGRINRVTKSFSIGLVALLLIGGTIVVPLASELGEAVQEDDYTTHYYDKTGYDILYSGSEMGIESYLFVYEGDPAGLETDEFYIGFNRLERHDADWKLEEIDISVDLVADNDLSNIEHEDGGSVYSPYPLEDGSGYDTSEVEIGHLENSGSVEVPNDMYKKDWTVDEVDDTNSLVNHMWDTGETNPDDAHMGSAFYLVEEIEFQECEYQCFKLVISKDGFWGDQQTKTLISYSDPAHRDLT